MFKILFYFFIFYLLYKLVFDFILPIYKSTKQVRNKINQMQQQQEAFMRQQQQQQNQYQQRANTSSRSETDSKDYIDFEEVK